MPSISDNPNLCQDIGDSVFKCNCPDGWAGPTCRSTIDTDDCLVRLFICYYFFLGTITCAGHSYVYNCTIKPQTSPCKHGTCTDNGWSRFSCDCDLGWEGITCATDVNDCDPSPCKNGGRCIDNGTAAYLCDCSCLLGWTGGNNVVTDIKSHPDEHTLLYFFCYLSLQLQVQIVKLDRLLLLKLHIHLGQQRQLQKRKLD